MVNEEGRNNLSEKHNRIVIKTLAYAYEAFAVTEGGEKYPEP